MCIRDRYKDDYISAFGKLALSEEWMADTLAKMRAAEAEQEAPGAAGPAGRPALRVSGKKHPVSYTHLDVYKRQSLESSTVSASGVCIV